MFDILARSAGHDVNAIVYNNIQPIIWGTTIPFAIFCLASCAIRLYARAVVAKTYGTDDWLMVVITIVWCGQQYIAWMWTILGGGKHSDKVSASNQYDITVYLFAEEFYYLFLELLIKLSFLFFYKRTLGVSNGVRRAIYIVMGIAIFQVSGTWIFYGLQCIPIGAYFHPENYPNAKCISSDISYYVPTVANIVVNLMVYLLPLYPVWGLQTTVKRRIKLLAMFTLGFAAITVSLCRFVVLWQLSNTTDVTYIFGCVTIVTSIEFDVAIITANSPGIAMFWHVCIQKRALGTSNPSADHLTPSGGNDALRMGNLSHVGGPGKEKSRRRSVLRSGPAWFDGDSEEELQPVIRGSRDKKVPSSDGNSDVEQLGEVKVDKRVTIRSERITDESLMQERNQPKDYYEFGGR